MTAENYRRLLVGEVDSLLEMVSDATEEGLLSNSPCSAWSLLDVARHVEVTPRTVAGHLLAHFREEPPPQVAPLAPVAGREEVMAGLELGAAQLAAALGQLTDEHLVGELPGPFGLMAGRAGDVPDDVADPATSLFKTYLPGP